MAKDKSSLTQQFNQEHSKNEQLEKEESDLKQKLADLEAFKKSALAEKQHLVQSNDKLSTDEKALEEKVHKLEAEARESLKKLEDMGKELDSDKVSFAQVTQEKNKAQKELKLKMAQSLSQVEAETQAKAKAETKLRELKKSLNHEKHQNLKKQKEIED